jgi:hypothetical protein
MSLFHQLPGVYLPLRDIGAIRRVWWSEGNDWQEAFQVCQFNLVLHYGYENNTEQALQWFQEACALTQDFPCRIWVICPEKEGFEGIEAKIFGICHLNRKAQKGGICEAIILRSSTNALPRLYDWVSLYSDNDLPLYLLSIKAGELLNLKAAQDFLRHSKALLWDSSLEPSLAVSGHQQLDLAWIRCWPIQRALGYFLAHYPPEVLVNGLERIELHYHPAWKGAAKVLGEWILSALRHCQSLRGTQESIAFEGRVIENPQGLTFEMQWHCKPPHTPPIAFRWIYKEVTQESYMEAKWLGSPAPATHTLECLSTLEALKKALLA